MIDIEKGLIETKESKDETKVYIECEVNSSEFEINPEPIGPFADKEIRNGFIRKVYAILFVQIAFTTVISGIMITFFRERLNFQIIEERKDGSAQLVVMLLLIVCMITTISICIIFCCSQCARRTVPINFILLGLFTCAETFIVGFVCAQNNGENIIIAFVITGVVVLAITLLATTPYFDITNCGCLLCILLVIHVVMGMLLVGVVLVFRIDAKPLFLALAVFGAFLFSLYLLYDTQLILGGKKYQMSPEEYIHGAICLYMDIIQIFLHILRILQIVNSN